MNSIEKNVSSIFFFDTKLVLTFNVTQLWKNSFSAAEAQL